MGQAGARQDVGWGSAPQHQDWGHPRRGQGMSHSSCVLGCPCSLVPHAFPRSSKIQEATTQSGTVATSPAT